MHDIFMCLQSLHKHVRDCNTILEGVNSNHRAVTLKLTLTSIKVQQSRAISKGATDWQKIQSDEHLQMMYNEHLQSMITPTMDYDEYSAAVLKAGELTMTVTKQKMCGMVPTEPRNPSPPPVQPQPILTCCQASFPPAPIRPINYAG
jgi:hypothetical protein